MIDDEKIQNEALKIIRAIEKKEPVRIKSFSGGEFKKLLTIIQKYIKNKKTITQQQ